MNLEQNIQKDSTQIAPDCSGSPEAIKAIFSRSNRATRGSSCCENRKKAFITRARAKSWNRHKKNKLQVAKITGPVNPKVGETNFYEVTEFHKGTVVIDPNTVKWKLYQYKDGKWYELSGPVKTGKKVTFSFPQKWYGKQLLVEAYIYDSEGKTPPGLVVKPVLGPKKILNTEILDANGGTITKPPKYGESITLKVTTENMLGETLKLSLWDRDTLSDTGHDPTGNQLLWEGKSKAVDNKGISTTKVVLSANMLVLAQKSMFDGSEHEYYLLVDGGKLKTISATTQVSSEIVLSPNQPPKKPDPKATPKEAPSIIDQIALKIKNAVGWDEIKVEGTTKAVVDKPEEKEKKEEGECPRCKILTAEEMTKVFPGASVADKDILRKAFNDANTKFGLDTCQQKAHFFAQVMEEVGSSIKVKDGESLNYRAEDLPIHFSRFRIDPNKKYNKTTNGPNNLAFQYGRIEEIRNGRKVVTQTANQEMIANITYANKEDNGDKDSGDGWKYRGRGIIQITFKRKYTNINRRIKDDYSAFTTIIDADNINNLKEGTIASMAYWEEYKCQSEASKGYSKKELDAIVDIINKDTESRGHRWTNLQSCITTFKVKECKNANPKAITTGDINKYKIEIDKFKYEKVMTSSTSMKYQYDIYDSGSLTKTITLDKNEHNLLPFPDTGINWGRFGTRDSGGDNWVDEKVCAALLGFFYSLPKNDYTETLYFNDISANDGRNIGHSGHRIGNDIDIRYPGSANSAGAVLWSKAAESYASKEKFLEVLENILAIGLKWGFNKNYAYKTGIKNTTGKATSIHQDHFHLGLR